MIPKPIIGAAMIVLVQIGLEIIVVVAQIGEAMIDEVIIPQAFPMIILNLKLFLGLFFLNGFFKFILFGLKIGRVQLGISGLGLKISIHISK